LSTKTGGQRDFGGQAHSDRPLSSLCTQKVLTLETGGTVHHHA
jgi:hypothetical protein